MVSRCLFECFQLVSRFFCFLQLVSMFICLLSFGIICSKWQILTIGIKMFIWIFSIGIKILFVYFQLVSILKCFYVSFQLVSKCSSLTYFNWYHKMFWFILPICKESLTSLLHIDSCCVYPILRSLTTLLYVVHVCRGSFTFPLMHCILCVM